jgi:cytoskeletal protein RodZ
MQPTTISEPQPKRHILLKVIVSIIVLAVIAGVTVFIVRAVHQASLQNEVKTELIKQNKLIKSAAKNNIYSPTLPTGVKTTDKVIINATISVSGTVYCIAGTSKSDGKIVYHMDKSTPEDQPQSGSCSGSATAPPETPSDVAVGSVGAGAVSLTWGEAPYAASYTVQCATDKAFISGLKSKSTSSTAVTIDGLDGSSHYFCRIAASNNLGQSSWSSTIDAVTNAISLAPTDLTLNTVSQSELSYSWKPVDGATGYILEYSPDVNFVNNVVTINTNVTVGSVKGLKTYTAYYFHVKAVTSGFDSSRATFSGMVLGRTAE